MKKGERCRHERNSWIIGGGRHEWCYVSAAAYRGLKEVDNGSLSQMTKWVKPTGNRDDNPYEKWRDR